MAQGTNVMPCSLVDWVLLQGHRIQFSLHRSNWIALRPSPCPTYPTSLNISSHAYIHLPDHMVSLSEDSNIPTHCHGNLKYHKYYDIWNMI